MKHDAYKLRLFIQWALGRHEAWAYGPSGLRAWPRTKGWGHGPYRWVKVQGPSRPGDPYAIQLYLIFFFFLGKEDNALTTKRPLNQR